MKTTIKNCRLALSLVYLLGMSQITHAQFWSRSDPNVYLTTVTDKVGIGTPTPTQKLDVKGDAVFNGVRVGLGNGGISSNTIIGNSALNFNTTGNQNTATGGVALYHNTTGNNNTATGYAALYLNTTGSVNTASGIFALYSNTTGYNNTANGYRALFLNTTGYYNTANGVSALYSNTTGYSNTANGYQALFLNTTGFNNNANGYQALYSNTTGNSNTASGYQALYLNTTGSDNTASGNYALYSNTTGAGNIANGPRALKSNITGSFNLADGYFALFANTTGQVNTAIGIQALYSNTSGGYNTAIGASALSSNTMGQHNTATGNQACGFNSTGSDNTASGNYALFFNTTGHDNVAIGDSALLSNTTGYDNVALGSGSNVSSGNLVFATAIGAGTFVNGSFRMQLGSSTTVLATSGGYTIVSDGRFKDEIKTDDAPGLAFINKLRPVAYNFNYKRYDDFLRKDTKETKDIKENKTIAGQYQQQLIEKGKQRQVGFIAQEVDQMCRDNKFTFNGVYTPQNSNDNYALDYSRFVVPLVKAVQELSSENDKLKEEINQLKATVYSSSNMNNGTASISVNAASEVPLLGQNIPNPAANNTIIPFRIPKNCNSASIVISEVGSRRIVTAIPVSCSETHLAIDAGTLASGSYTYSLYINGKLVDSKQMILTK